MATTGQVYPGNADSVSETGYANNTWISPGNITADDTSYASVTAATFDSPDKTYVLKAYAFDFSSIPDGSTINGVTLRMRAWYANGTGNIVLAQLLNTSRARVGTNKYSSFTNLTTSEATYTKGSAADLWGNALTAAWVKNSNFGVGIAMGATGADTDVFVDWVTLEIDYTPPGDQTVTAAVGVLTLGGNAASIVPGAVTVQANAGALAIAGHSAAVVPGTATVQAAAGGLTLSGNAAAVIPGAASVAASAGLLTLSANSATITPGAVTVQAAVGALTLDGNTASVSADGSPQTVTVSAGGLALTGQTASVLAGAVSIACNPGLLLLAGNAAQVSAGDAPQTVTTTAGALVMTGLAALVVPGAVSVSAGPGLLALAGNAVTIDRPGAVTAGHASSSDRERYGATVSSGRRYGAAGSGRLVYDAED